MSTRRQVFKDSLRGVLIAQNIDVSLDNFPYFLSATTKDVLKAWMSVHMKGGSKFTKYASDLPTTCILLSGPAGGSTLSSIALPKQEVQQQLLRVTRLKQDGLCHLIGGHFLCCVSSLQGPPLRGPTIGF
ncbi:hypothetical protein F2Q69_00039468 [Brassica cretica]|uniref:Uncharacterized protein n=1 Tax=Brassica cretica TaxID=69181 RepID=A0A8S9NK89_BRACR|nr:hypothetical protein F2Q69_00039468 [Brassica cretica]